MRNGIEVEPLVTRPRKLIPRVWKKLRSLRLVDRRFPEVFEEALALQEVFTRCEVDAVFDVGANEGQFRRRVERLGFRGKVISFEPDPDCVAVLTAASKGDPNWIIEPYGLGDAEGSLILNRTKASGMNSFLQPTSGSGTGFEAWMEVKGRVEVPVRRLDAEIERLQNKHDFKRPFLKMATQGYDGAVIRGAGTELQRFVGLQTEMSIVPFYEDMPTMVEHLDLLMKRGFRPISIFKSGAFPPLRVSEMDGVFVRSDLQGN